MARNVQTAVENNFSAGLITEANALNFPPNACTETDNVVFDEKGKVTRRLGFDFETGYTLNTFDFTDQIIQGYTWKNAGGSTTATFRVVQIGRYIRFFRIYGGQAASSLLHATAIDLNTYRTGGSIVTGDNKVCFTSTNKYLVVSHPQCESFYVTYDPSADTLTGTAITLKIRDFTGLDDTYAVDNRPTSTVAGLSKEHKYNLFNQGWYFNTNAALTAWDTAFSTMPSNADVWWFFKDTTDAFNTAMVALRDPGTSPAPKGHYVLDLHNQDRTTASGVSSITAVTTSTDRVSTNAFFAGRVFYSGLNYPGYANEIYFTQIIEDYRQFGYCYQANDPTSELAFDLLSSDGGVIKLFEAENIINMFPMGNSLIVFCSNGIWAISGSTGLGFTATDYSVSKISSTPATSGHNFMDMDGSPVWCGLDGIYILIPGKDGAPVVQSLTDKKVRTFYNLLPIRSKVNAKGAHDIPGKHLRWLFRTQDSDGVEEDSRYDTVLNYNLLTGAFYTWSVGDQDDDSSNNVFIHDLFSVDVGSGPQVVVDMVAESGNNIIDEAADNVIILSGSTGAYEPNFLYMVSKRVAETSTFATTTSSTYKDWYSFNNAGESFSSSFTTGYRIDGQAQNYVQSNYVLVFLDQEEGAQCLMRGVWEWTSSENSNRWSAQQTIYNQALTNRAVNYRKLKVRGKGKALQLRFDSQGTSPFTILGWSIWETQNATV